MSRCLRNNGRRALYILGGLFALNLFLVAPPAAQAQEESCNLLLKEPLVKFNSQSYEYEGLTQKGLQALKEARDHLRQRARLFESEILGLNTLHHAGTISRLTKGNMFIYGPPGGAKSMFANWMAQGEADPAFKIQLHQMVTEQALIGGQDFEAAQRGEYRINTKGSLADFRVAILDEIDKGNPAVFATLLSLLNEREILVGNQVIKAKLETLFATSNANLPEIQQQFLENGQGTTAPALLNRFQTKAFVYNWLTPEAQIIIDDRQRRREYLTNLAQANPEILKDEIFQQPQEVQWDELRHLAAAMFGIGENLDIMAREFADDMRTETNRAVRESEDRHKASQEEEPFVYFPSFEPSERLRQQILPTVQMSAFVDFLLSPLADDETLEAMTKKQTNLGPLSLWRAYLIMTTVGPGESRLVLEPESDQKINIDFDFNVDPASALNRREELLIQNLKSEQARFAKVYLRHIEKLQETFKFSAQSASGNRRTLNDTSFELRLLQSMDND